MTIDEYRVLSERVQKWEDLKADLMNINSWLIIAEKLKRSGSYFEVTIRVLNPSINPDDLDLQIRAHSEEFREYVVDWIKKYQSMIFDELEEL